MPKVAYSEQEKARIREQLIITAFELMRKQGIQHTTIEQVYKQVGISRTFFYSFFSTKEDLVVETLYFQQPKIIDYTHQLMADPNLEWKAAVRKFLYECCCGEKYGIIILSIEEQQLIFNRISKQSYTLFRQKQFRLFNSVLKSFGIKADEKQTQILINLFLGVMVLYRAIPETLPMFVPEASEEAICFQIDAIVDYLDQLRA